jgi:hypothetical protein
LSGVIPDRAENPGEEPVVLVPVWVGHSCPTPLTLILILIYFDSDLDFDREGHGLSRAADRAKKMEPGFSR